MEDAKFTNLKWLYVKTEVELVIPLMNWMLTKSAENEGTAWEEILYDSWSNISKM